MASSTEELRFRAVGQDVSAGRMFDKLGDKADDAKDEVKGLDRQLGKLDEQLDLTKLHLAVLIKEFDETGDKTLFRDIRRDRSTIRMLESMQAKVADIGDEGENAGVKIRRGLTSSLRDSLSSLPSELKGAAIVGAVGVGAAMAPFLGAAISGAVLGGIGAGGIIGGIALASRDSRVQAAAKDLGGDLMAGLSDGATVFVDPVVRALQRLRPVTAQVTGSLAHDFAMLAPLVDPLADGLSGMATKALPGLEHATEAARVPLQALANEMPELGDAVSDFLDSIAGESDNATKGVVGLADAVEFAIRETGSWLGYLGALYGGIVDVSNATSDWTKESGLLGDVVASVLGPAFSWWGDEASNQVDALDAAKDAVAGYSGSVRLMASAQLQAADATEAMNRAFDDAFGIVMDLNRAQLAYQKSIDDTMAELKDGPRTLDANSQAGRDNRDAVLDQVQAIQRLRDANIDNGMSIDDANAAYAGQLDSLRLTLLRLGYNTAAVNTMIAAYAKIPATAETQIKTPGLSGAISRLYEFVRLLGAAEGARAFEFSEYRRDERRASGGSVKAGRTYMVGEDGPELVTFGADGYVHNTSDTKAMMSGASGGSAMPAAGGAGGEMVHRFVFELVGGDEELRRWFKKSVRIYGGGDVQVAYGSS